MVTAAAAVNTAGLPGLRDVPAMAIPLAGLPDAASTRPAAQKGVRFAEIDRYG